MSDKKRLLNDLRVIDLRAELEKRNLDKSGVRGVLIQRLSKSLEEEGHDPQTYSFDLSGEPRTPSKRTRGTGSTVEQEAEGTPALEDMVVQDDACEEEETEQVESPNKKATEHTEVKTEDDMDVDEKVTRKRESKEEPEATEAKKPCIEEENKVENNLDTEDSINLDLGDDELLNEETDNTEKGQDHVEDRQGRPPPSPGRPVLAQLITATDLDDGVLEAADEPGESAATEAADANAAPATEEHQVNSEAASTSVDGEKSDKELKDDKDKDVDGDKKEKREDVNKEGGARNLWVSGLSGDTRAKDLKQLCSKHGKVIGAKVVTNARTPGSRCYGYVTMASAQDAESCIKNLHRTELHGRMISVEKAKSESESSARRQPSRNEKRPSREGKEEKSETEEIKEPTTDNNVEKVKTEGNVSGAESNRSTSESRDKNRRLDKDKIRRSTRSRERKRSPREVLSFSKIWKEKEVARARERSRAAREEERRRRAAEEALRERERRQRQEKHRLAIEREKLRTEREKIEREKNELLRLERERHRLEREKLELERLELKRAQIRLEEERRKRGYESGSYRKAGSPPPEPAYERDRHKRVPPPPMSSNRGPFDAPPPPRFELSGGYERPADKRDRERDYKREYPRHAPPTNLKYPANGSTNDDSRQPMPPGTRPKEPGRSYEARDGRSYRTSPPGKPEPRGWNATTRYPDTATAPKAGAASSGEPWGGEARYAAYSAHSARYSPAYQPPPPGAAFPDRYAPPRDYQRKY